ncbi:MAG TPA: hypothetical protein EYG69_01680 [Campylobacterales bacterium]|nr:hypothetical protein [Campylobacterales bacterium]
MTSKSILLLGIVFIFLLNVVAVHNYIDNSYYNSYKPTSSVKKIEKVEKKVILQKNKSTTEDISLYKSLHLSSAKEENKYIQKLLSKQQKKIEKKEKRKAPKLEQNMIIELELNINNSYEQDNPIIKKIANKFNKNSKIVIKIYHFNQEIKNFIKHIKDDLVTNEIDIDDIKVIFNKTEQENKNKIKVLLLKKD